MILLYNLYPFKQTIVKKKIFQSYREHYWENAWCRFQELQIDGAGRSTDYHQVLTELETNKYI